MRTKLTSFLVTAIAIATSAVALAPAPASGTTPSIDWPAYLGGPLHSSYSPAATAITPTNAASLTQAWAFNPPGVGTLGNKFVGSPTVFQGQVFIGSENGTFYDLNEATGAVIWSHFIGQLPKLTCPAMSFVSTATVAPDPTTGVPTVYEAAPDGYLYAWKAADGTQTWRSVVAIPSTTQSDYLNWSSATVANNRVYVGVSSNCDVPLVQAGVRSFDQATGNLVASFQTNPAGDLGGSIWSSPLVASDGSVYVTTGNQQPQGALGDSQSIIRLDGQTLAQVDIFAVPPADRVGDGDFGGSPTTWNATIGGTPTPLVGACNKNGKYYALRLTNLAAGAVWTDQVGYSEQTAGHQSLCIAAAVWDGDKGRLYLSGNATVIGGNTYRGSVREVNPATGAPLWQTPLPASVLGTPTLDGSGVLAVPTADYSGVPSAVYLLNAATGAILDTVSTNGALVFSQPVFADGYLFVATMGQGLFAYRIPSTPPAPTVMAVSPSSGPAHGGTAVTITGTGFSGVTKVSFGSAAATSFTVVSGSQINATAPAGAGTVDVKVTTPAGTSAPAPTDAFTYGTSLRLSLSPPSIQADLQSTSQATATVVDVNGAPLVNESISFATTGNEVVSPVTNKGNGTYTATVTSSREVGQFPLTATDTSASPAASGTATLTQTEASAPPAVTGLSPTSGAAAGGTTVTITGSGFVGVTDVRFGNAEATTYSVDSVTQITAVAPSAPPGVKSAVVMVTNGAGSSRPQAGDRYTYVYSQPAITGVSPSGGPSAGGTVVTITGSNFTGASGVSFGSILAGSFTVDSSTQITATAPARPVGTVNISITSPAGHSPHVVADRFTYQ